MKKALFAAVSASVVALTMATSVALAQQDTTICRSTIEDESVVNIRVPQNATCTLIGTDVGGNIDVRAGARLTASGVEVGGNVTANGYQVVRVNQRSSVDGDVRLRAGRSGGTGVVATNTIGGDLRIEENSSQVSANYNRIGGDLRVEENRGGLTFTNNRITETFECEDNRPAPTGSGNTAQSKEGQCSRL